MIIKNDQDIIKETAIQAKEKRLGLNLSRLGLSTRSGVPASTIRKFETTGEISFKSLLKIALALDCLDTFTNLFKTETYSSLEELRRSEKKRKRGRK